MAKVYMLGTGTYDHSTAIKEGVLPEGFGHRALGSFSG